MYRNTVWFIKGMREYTKGGYLTASKKFKNDDLDVDCSNRAFMITGANSGIGKQVRLIPSLANTKCICIKLGL